MHVAVTGASGFIGTALSTRLIREGHQVSRLVRRGARAPDEIPWDIEAGRLDPSDLAGVDAVVHLAGEGIAERRWSDAQKRRILESRAKGTRLVAEAIAAARGPQALICASGINYYGDRGTEVLTEDSPAGVSFLTDVVRAWEGGADPAREAGIRVVHTRFGLIQSPDGGMLPRILWLFKLGLGGRLGSGKHLWSWVGLPDVIEVLVHTLSSDLVGPVNVTAPDPVTNAEYTKTLARVLNRPAVLPVPKFAPALLYGRELVDELLFTSAAVLPGRLMDRGWQFHHTDLETCLRDLLDRPAER